MRKQQSLGLRLKTLFPSEAIEEEQFTLHYRTDFKFKNHMLMLETDEKDMLTETQITKGIDKKN